MFESRLFVWETDGTNQIEIGAWKYIMRSDVWLHCSSFEIPNSDMFEIANCFVYRV